MDCPHVNDCRYSAKSIYVDNDRFPWYSWQCLGKPYEEATREEKTQSLKTFNPHGECAFKVQSDLVDHQAVILQFSDGSTATHSMIQGSVRALPHHPCDGYGRGDRRYDRNVRFSCQEIRFRQCGLYGKERRCTQGYPGKRPPRGRRRRDNP